MKFRFESDLPHQTEAIEAVCDLFRGAETNATTFTVMQDPTGQLSLAGKTLGYGNRLSLLDDDVLTNLRDVQARAGLEIDEAIDTMDFTVEMETGTGKTYVYLRTIFELNRRYGFTKFVVVVPSVAIREGVNKSIAQMRAHFHDLYDGVPFDSFVYDSSRLDQITDFATASTIRVMVATIQSLGTKSAVFQQAREQTQDIPAVEWVAETRPVIIIDEPQSVDANPTGAGAQILKAMKPLASLRYSATHVRQFHHIHRLDAFDAHDQGLVKSIEVDGANIQDAENSPLVKLIRVDAKKGQLPRARIEVSVQRLTHAQREEMWASDGDDLRELTGRDIYANMSIGEVDAHHSGSMQLLLPGEVKTLNCGQSHGDVDADSLARAMIARTIKHHFDKEVRNRPIGIKTLSLFFLNRVADYREYMEDGSPRPGKLASTFEEEYRKLALRPEYKTLFVDAPADPATAHDGYFSRDKRGHFIEYEEGAGGELNAASAKLRDNTFDLIMKDKERLLDEKEPLRFIFSHSALREGWDNPNVFQICVLRAMGAERQRRQSIGRGLRLAVDKEGIRRRDEGLNRLTVVSDEQFQVFAKGLQDEVEQSLGVKLGVVERDLFAGLRYPLPDGGIGVIGVAESRAVYEALDAAGMIDGGKVNDRLRAALSDGTVPLPKSLPEPAARIVRERLTRLARTLKITNANRTGRINLDLDVLNGHDFQQLWSRISWKTTYRLKFDDAVLVAACAKAIAEMPEPGEARVVFETGSIEMGREGVFVSRTGTSVPRKLQTEKLPVPDLLSELQDRTDLPRAVIAKILVQSGRLAEASVNPTAFLDACTVKINAAKRTVLVGGVTYRQLDERWGQELFQPEDDVDETRMVTVTKTPLDAIVVDSTVERTFATDLNDSAAIRVFAKLPKAFKITTPLGTYNPDWAIAREDEDDARVYLVTETKGDDNNLRDAEKDQIACGKAHFEALGISFRTARALSAVLKKGY